MVFAEFVALLGFICLGILGVRVVWELVGVFKQRSQAKINHDRKMIDDLRTALESRDHQRLSDWLVIYADCKDPVVKQIVAAVQHRRDELYIDKNG